MYMFSADSKKTVAPGNTPSEENSSFRQITL